MPQHDYPDEIDHLRKQIETLKVHLEEYKNQAARRFEKIEEEMKNVARRTERIKELADKLEEMIREHKEQLAEFQNNISGLTRTITELLESKKLMDESREELKKDMQAVKTQLEIWGVTTKSLSKLPEKVEQLVLGMNSIKTITDTITRVGWLFVGGIVVLVINNVFGGG